MFIESHSPAETYQLGRYLGSVLQTPQLIALHGELGAGKTALTQGIAAGLGLTARVTSPTFILVNHYPLSNGATLVHIDCYRLGEATPAATTEAATFGLEELIEDPQAIVVIEWAERIAPLLPADHLQITLTRMDADATTRQIELIANGPHSAQVLQQFASLPVGQWVSGSVGQ
jgi:tRNA threonylcarbamoyladenosine biosynthesis protein TsaE